MLGQAVQDLVLQVLALTTTMTIFLDPRTNTDALGVPQDPTGTIRLFIVVCLLWVTIRIPALIRRRVIRGGGGPNVVGMALRMVTVQRLTGLLRLPAAAARMSTVGAVGRAGAGAGAPRLPRPLGPASAASTAADPAGSTRRVLPPPRGAGQGRVGIAWPTGRTVWPYTPDELAAGVDPYTRTVPRRSAPPPRPRPSSTRPPIRAMGVVTPLAPTSPRPTIPPGRTPATAMPSTRPVRPPNTGVDRPHRRQP